MSGMRGLTFTELLIALAIAALLAAVAMPNLRAYRRQAELSTASLDLFNAIRATRNLAVARNSLVYLLPAGPAHQDWQSGWIISADPDGSAVLARHDALAAGLEVTASMSGDPAATYIAYNGAGRSCRRDGALAARWGSIHLRQPGHERRIIINMLGRPRLCDPARPEQHCG